MNNTPKMIMQALDTDIHTLWSTIKSDLQSVFPHDVYHTWFENLNVVKYDNGKVLLEVPNDFAAIWVQDNYNDLLQKQFLMALGHAVKIEYQVDQDATKPQASKASEGGNQYDPENRLNTLRSDADKLIKKKPRNTVQSGAQDVYLLNPKNTFDNFVVGSGNQLAHAACIAVANAPAKAYNPLFLYGDTGLGKTHLMHAVSHAILGNKPNAKVAYISTEKFTNEFIRAIQENTLLKFRQHYRSVDILLIDDIHFLSGKERIQEEFFHTFNELFESQKQIFLCSDRPASEIAKLENRLVSRFQWGLVTDIQAPDLETRMAILSKKASAMNLELPENVIQFLAERVARNVRRMEGALTRVAGYAALVNGQIDIPSVEKLLKDILQEEAQNQITIEKIQNKVCEHFNLRHSDMLSKRRPANIAFPRQIAMYMSRTLTSESLSDIGESFGGRDHGTVIHACKAVENMMEQDESVKRNVEYIQEQLTCNR